MVRILDFSTVPFENILKDIKIAFHQFDLTKCDEKTFYLSIAISTKQQHIACDLIYLLDKQNLYGALSLNDNYNFVRSFFKKYFDYELLYSDEQIIAKLVCQSPYFKKHLKHYALKYPKYAQQHFLN